MACGKRLVESPQAQIRQERIKWMHGPEDLIGSLLRDREVTCSHCLRTSSIALIKSSGTSSGTGSSEDGNTARPTSMARW